MNEKEEQLNNVEEQKRKIRERYKGINPDELDLIPAREKKSITQEDNLQRVAVYARVSTDDPHQTSSYELQKNHYEDFVATHPNWQLVKIYADEGISGTSLQHRESFLEMLKDCEAGKIDLIITKSVSRFARNIVDCIKTVRDLKKMQPPVGVLFEMEHLYTLDENSEVPLSIMSTVAQEESHKKSDAMNASVEMRFRRGIFLTPALLGYDKDEDGNLVVNEEEAKIVRLIFYLYLDGHNCTEIANILTSAGQATKRGKSVWSATTITNILQNERHCGDVLARKTWTPSYLDHKPRKNNQDRNQYRQKNHHEAIISRDDFIAVQRLISNAKYGNKGFLPELHVIPSGILKGYVAVHPRWGGFTADDYYKASDSVGGGTEPAYSNIEVRSGDFDLRGYEVARVQFFDTQKIAVTIAAKDRCYITFSSKAIHKLENCQYIEFLLHPRKRIFAVRPCTKESRLGMQWAWYRQGRFVPKKITGSAFVPTLYKIFQWDGACGYRFIGQVRSQDNETLILFNIDEVETIIPTSVLKKRKDLPCLKNRKNISAYPETWADNFGSEYYTQVKADEFSAPAISEDWNPAMTGQTYKISDLQTTNPEERRENIASLLNSLNRETTDEKQAK